MVLVERTTDEMCFGYRQVLSRAGVSERSRRHVRGSSNINDEHGKYRYLHAQ